MNTDKLVEAIEKHNDWFAPEELHPDLKACLTTGPDKTPWLKHHLINQPWYTPSLNKQMNLAYKYKTERIKELEETGQFTQIIFYYERPWRLDAFIQYKEKFSPVQYWESLASVWVDAENPNRNKIIWLILFQMPRPHRELMMDEDERKVFEGLPDEFTIYRGCQPRWRLGLSWTLNEARAGFFATRWGRIGRVYAATVKKKDVFAYLSHRNEEEIVVNPKRLKNIKSHETTKPQRRASSTPE